MNVFTPDDRESIAKKARTVLAEVGYSVEHEALCAILEARGIRPNHTGRYPFDASIIDDFVADRIARARRLAGSRPVNADSGDAAVPSYQDKPFRSSFGNEASKYYDYSLQAAVTGTMAHLETLTRFAHSCDQIAGIGMPIIAAELPTITAPVAQLLAMMRLTHKHPRRLEPYSALQIPFFAELSDLLLGPGCEAQFIGQCDCINPILRLERRTASVMVEKAKYGVGTLMTSMPAAGGNAPVTIDGAVIQGVAEIVGGLIIAWLLLPDFDHRGYISTGAVDLRTAVTTQSSPETVLIDCGVFEVMEHAFGGNTGIGGKTYVAARTPGIRNVYEKLFKTAAYARFGHSISYAGAGILDNGSMISPEQLLLDMEIGESFHRLSPHPPTDDSVVQAIAEVAREGRGDFLSHPHTLDRFRGSSWEPSLFLRGVDRSEDDILRQAHAQFTGFVDSYKHYDWNEEEVREVSRVLERMKQTIL